MRRTAWLTAPVLLASCYLSPSKHDSDESNINTSGVGATDADTAKLPPPTCTSATSCPPESPSCVSGTCAGCVQHADCAAFPATPACGPGGECVACTADEQRACGAPTSSCDALTNRCVACLADAQCTDPQHSACNVVAHACEPCIRTEQCAHVAGKGICQQGTCVACTAGAVQACRETLAGGELRQYVCDPATHACDKARLANSKTLCDSCISDLECAPGQLCVDAAAGAGARVCQQISTAAKSCARPYGDEGGPPITSVDGARANICTLVAETTCEAQRQFRNRRCGTPVRPGASEDIKGTGTNARCGVDGRDDGYCVWYERLRQHLCTTACRNNVADCPVDAIGCSAQEHEKGTRSLCTL
jgi:hypothetical protein